ncbi:MAG: C39 family peptidase [Methanosarcina sp.]
MIINKFGIRTLILAILLIGMVLIPAVDAQEENKYSVTAEEAFRHANAHMIKFIATDTQNFEDWTGASIDSKPLELYDPNGQKLYYQFSVYKNNNLIGIIDIGADKKLGQTVQLVEFNPKPFDSSEAIKKSIDIAKNNYPDGEIKLTKMVVYDYPLIGAMTVVKDKTTGDEHRIFVDAYTLDVVPDEPATETKRGIWSIYEQRLKNGVDKNLKNWQESDNLTKSVEQEATSMGINISTPITEEQMEKLSGDAVTTTTATTKTLNVPLYGGEETYYCGPTTAQMIAKYYGVSHSQDYIYGIMGGVAPNGVNNSQQRTYYISSQGLAKTHSIIDTDLTFGEVVTEINNKRPFKSGISDHARACVGYYYNTGEQLLAINDPRLDGLVVINWKHLVQKLTVYT